MSNKFIHSTIRALATPQKPPLPPWFSSLQVRRFNHAPRSAKLLRTHNIAGRAVFFPPKSKILLTLTVEGWCL